MWPEDFLKKRTPEFGRKKASRGSDKAYVELMDDNELISKPKAILPWFEAGSSMVAAEYFSDGTTLSRAIVLDPLVGELGVGTRWTVTKVVDERRGVVVTEAQYENDYKVGHRLYKKTYWVLPFGLAVPQLVEVRQDIFTSSGVDTKYWFVNPDNLSETTGTGVFVTSSSPASWVSLDGTRDARAPSLPREVEYTQVSKFFGLLPYAKPFKAYQTNTKGLSENFGHLWDIRLKDDLEKLLNDAVVLEATVSDSEYDMQQLAFFGERGRVAVTDVVAKQMDMVDKITQFMTDIILFQLFSRRAPTLNQAMSAWGTGPGGTDFQVAQLHQWVGRSSGGAIFSTEGHSLRAIWGCSDWFDNRCLTHWHSQERARLTHGFLVVVHVMPGLSRYFSVPSSSVSAGIAPTSRVFIVLHRIMSKYRDLVLVWAVVLRARIDGLKTNLLIGSSYLWRKMSTSPSGRIPQATQRA